MPIHEWPVRVMHVIDKLSMNDANPSSCTILLGDWIPCLDPNRFDISVCSLQNPGPAGKWLEDRGVRVHYLGLGKYSPISIREISSLIAREGIEILHLHGYSSSNFGRIASKIKGVRNVVHEHAILDVQPHQYLADRTLARFTDAAVAVSGSVRDFMVHGRSIPASKISIIPNGIRIDRFQKSHPHTIREKKAELGISDNHRVIGTVGRLRAEKGNEYFIRAVPRVLRQFPETVFLVIGEGPLRGELEALAHELDESRHIRFLGFRKDVVELLSIMDITVIPSLSEGFPLSLIEAMSVGNPIVATSVGGMREIIRNNETALLIPPEDPVELGDKVSFLLKDPPYAAKLAERAKKASRTFTVEASVGALAELYLSIR